VKAAAITWGIFCHVILLLAVVQETMSRQRNLDEIITTFLLNTCRLRPQISKHAIEAVIICVATLMIDHTKSIG